jgi:hypothetical protein
LRFVRRSPVRVILVAWLVCWAVFTPIFGFRSTTELRVYIAAAGRLAAGTEIYRPHDAVSIFAYPPAFALPFVPLAALSETAQRVLWVGANALMTVLAVALLQSIVAPHLRRAAARRQRTVAYSTALFWGLVAVLGARHLLSPLENQSHDLVILLLVLGGTWLAGRGREAASGACYGVAAALKATPLLFLPVLLWQRRWRAAVALMVALLLVSVAADLVLPRADGTLNLRHWIDMARGAGPPAGSEADADTPDAPRLWGGWNYLNQNLADTLHRLTAPSPWERGVDVSVVHLGDRPRWLLIKLLQGVVALAVFAAVTRRRAVAEAERPLRRLAEAGAVVCGMLLLSPMSSKSHFCLLLLPLAALGVDFLFRRRDPWVGLALLVVLLAGTLTARGIVGRDLGIRLLSVGTVALCTLALLLADGRTLWTRPWDDAEVSPP